MVGRRVRQIRNPNIEIRDKFEIRMTKSSKPIEFFCLRHFEFEHSDLFRNSDFELGVLGGKDSTALLIERGINNESA